jgi:hypothetical protein
VRVLLLILALLQATGVAEAMRRQACEAECRDDGCDNDCTPGSEGPACPCHCPSMPTHAAPVVIMTDAPLPTAAPPVRATADRAHGSPDPREIAHVPRRDV